MCECFSEISQESAMNMYQRVFMAELRHKMVYIGLFEKLVTGRQKNTRKMIMSMHFLGCVYPFERDPVMSFSEKALSGKFSGKQAQYV